MTSSVPDNFILTSDYVTLKNDTNGSTSITMPASVVIPATSPYSLYSDITLGASGGTFNMRVSSTNIDTTWQWGTGRAFNRNGTSGAGSASYVIYALATKINATTIRCYLNIFNNYGASLTTSGTSETVTFYIKTFLPPFN